VWRTYKEPSLLAMQATRSAHGYAVMPSRPQLGSYAIGGRSPGAF
jgi:hypothetical protein